MTEEAKTKTEDWDTVIIENTIALHSGALDDKTMDDKENSKDNIKSMVVKRRKRKRKCQKIMIGDMVMTTVHNDITKNQGSHVQNNGGMEIGSTVTTTVLTST